MTTEYLVEHVCKDLVELILNDLILHEEVSEHGDDKERSFSFLPKHVPVGLL